MSNYLQNRRFAIFLCICLISLLAACQNDEEPQVETPSVVQNEIEATPPPTLTPIPVDSEPTQALTPTPEPSPTSTETPMPTFTPTPPPEVIKESEGDGRLRIAYPYEGLTISIPPLWRVAELVTEEVDIELNDLYTSNGFRDLKRSGMKLFAINFSDSEDVGTTPMNMNLVILDRTDNPTIDRFGSEIVDQISYNLNISPESIVSQPITIDEQAALRVDYTQELQTPLGERVNLNLTHILAVQPGKAYNLTLTTPDVVSDTIESTFTDFSQNIELNPVVAR